MMHDASFSKSSELQICKFCFVGQCTITEGMSSWLSDMAYIKHICGLGPTEWMSSEKYAIVN